MGISSPLSLSIWNSPFISHAEVEKHLPMPTPFVGAQSKPRQPLCIVGFHCYTHEHAACSGYNGIEKAIAPQTILNEW